MRYVFYNGTYLYVAQDDKPVYENVEAVGINIPYGNHPREIFDIIIPSSNKTSMTTNSIMLFIKNIFDLLTMYPRGLLYVFVTKRLGYIPPELEKAKNYPALLFIHGGGYVAIDPCLQHSQLTPFARNGKFSVYSMSYPHAPEDQYPTQLISTLRALSWLKTFHQHDSVTIVGESAGGALATQVAGLLSNRDTALVQFHRILVEQHGMNELNLLLEWDFPTTIKSVTSWYGVLDGESWKWKGSLWWGLHFTQQCYLGINPFPLRWTSVTNTTASNDRRKDCPFRDFVSMMDNGLIHNFPPCLLICGKFDSLGLVHSNRLAEQKLKQILSSRNATNVHYREFPANHAFIGVQPFILWFFYGNEWRNLALPAMMESVQFAQKQYLL
jgi:acetyl esterase/lipase